MVTRRNTIYKLLKKLEERDRFDFTEGYTPCFGATSLGPWHTEFSGIVLPEDLDEGEYIELLEDGPERGVDKDTSYRRICRKEGNSLVVVAESEYGYPEPDVWYAELKDEEEEIKDFIEKYGKDKIKEYL